MSFEEPLVFGPVPKPAGYVDPDTIDPIIFGPPRQTLVQRLRAKDLAQEDLPNVSEERAKELDDLMM
ncbi:hypothetical protein Tco_0547129, partial [Tanacetum coccineum]